jgi:hypothetical protein
MSSYGFTDDDLKYLRIKGSPSDRDRNVSRGELSTHGVPMDPRVPRNELTPAKKRGKYRAEPTEVDGHRFPSKREATRYEHLKLMQKAGEIADLELQPQYPIVVTTPAGVKVKAGVYTADFRYTRKGGGTVIEDAKGFKANEAYRLRKRIVEAQYGIEIQEV